MSYKVGDRVRIKSLDWYNENKDEHGNIDINYDFTFYADRSKYCGKVFTISKVFDNSYLVKEDNGDYYWTDEMIEGLVEEEEVGLVDKLSSRWVNEFNLPNGYIFKDENGNVINATKIVLEKKKKEYPKTYEECCRVMGINPHNELCVESTEDYADDYENKLFDKVNTLYKLLICRDAYWKIAGEEMGLDEPWKPDWDNISDKYCIYFVSGHAWSKECQTRQCPFAFPTPEMRDAFKENFDPDIEICKELL